MGLYVADFETTTNEDKTHVWAYAIVDVETQENIVIGTNINEFMNWCIETHNPKVYFHNLKFDSQFIMSWLFKNGYTHTTEKDKNHRDPMTFNTLISDKGLYYSIEVIFKRGKREINKVTFLDSLKLIPMGVDKIAKSFKLPISKLQIDYKSHDDLPEDSPLTQEEIDYITNDVKIVAYAINYFQEQGLTKMTIGSCALNEYKNIISKRSFNRYFPPPKFHDDVKQSYRGGFTYLLPMFASKTIGNGLVFDVNSLYPSVMSGCDKEYLPFGIPIFFQGKYEHDPIYPIYTQMFKCIFTIKKGKIPTIQIKYSADFKSNEYLTSSNGEEVTLCLNSVDMKLFLEHYDILGDIEYISGWKFKATYGLFNDYIEKWSNNKIQAKLDGNHGLYLISKLFLNSLYGKFGTDNKVRSKIPYLGEDNIVHFKDSEVQEKEGIYVAMASFITSYARLKTITAFQRLYDNYNQGKSKAIPVYADTDSLHINLNGENEEEFIKTCGLDIDNTKLGAWKFESKFDKAKFLRQKCYIENSTEDVYNPNPEYELKVTCAGMPKDCHHLVTFENFEIGASYYGKKQPKVTQGGMVLVNVDFTIKKS